MEVVVGRIGRAHGVRGDLAVEPSTDSPEVRFAPGNVLTADGPGPGDGSTGSARRRLTVESVRWHSGRLLVRFADVADRDTAIRLQGSWLVVDVSLDEETGDPDEFFDHQLVGLTVVDAGGSTLGTVEDVVHLPGQDVLAVRTPDDQEVLVPFVSGMVPSVELAAGRLTVTPPDGLF